MPADLIPALDPIALPGPPWLFHVLWVVTFLIHVAFLNLVLGGSLLAAISGGNQPGRRETRKLLLAVNSWTISFAITFGIAPLLFAQVLFGRFFYTATVLVAWWWLGMLVLVAVGYYLHYLAKHLVKKGASATAVLTAEAVCFLLVAAIQVTVNLLQLQPGRWESVVTSVWAALADPAFVPRYLHFGLAALTMTGALVAWAAVRRGAGSDDPAAANGMARFGIRVALFATVLQLLDGFWLLLALPHDVLIAFMRGGVATMLPLTLGILGGLGLLMVLAQIHDPLQQATKVRRVAEILVGAMLVMVLTRHQLRGLYLAAHRADEQLKVAVQTDVLVLFLLVFVVGVAVTAWAMKRAATDKPQAGEPAA